MPVCSECGHEYAEGSRFCPNCGTRLLPADGGGNSAAAPAPEERPAEQTATISAVSTSADADADRAQMELRAQEQAAVDALPAGCALLIVQRGPSAGSRFLLDTDVVTAGRHPDSDIFLDDVTVSRRHVEFRKGESGYSVCDVGSLNGTYVNRDRIDEVPLTGGDEVQIGKFRLVYFSSPATGTATGTGQGGAPEGGQ